MLNPIQVLFAIKVSSIALIFKCYVYNLYKIIADLNRAAASMIRMMFLNPYWLSCRIRNNRHYPRQKSYSMNL